MRFMACSEIFFGWLEPEDINHDLKLGHCARDIDRLGSHLRHSTYILDNVF